MHFPYTGPATTIMKTPADSDQERAAPAPTLLVVDDDPAILHVLGYALGAAGFRVVLATSGERALSLFDPQTTQAVIADVRMRRLQGFQVCEEVHLRARAAGRETPVWLMTGERTAEVERRACEVGAIAVFWKPFDLAVMTAELRARLGPAPGKG